MDRDLPCWHICVHLANMFSSHITRFIVAWLLFGGIGAFGAKCLAAGGKVELRAIRTLTGRMRS